MRSYKWVNVVSFSILKLFQLKVSKLQNDCMNLLFLPKYRQSFTNCGDSTGGPLLTLFFKTLEKQPCKQKTVKVEE